MERVSQAPECRISKPPQNKKCFSITAAHRVTGKSRTTLQRRLKTGKLSCTTDSDGNKLIDTAELIRVSGDACDFSREFEGAEEGASAKPAGDADGLRKQLELINEERRRDRE